MKVDEISSWEAFRAVATHGNFSKAGETLHLTTSQISKRVSKIEGQLGVRLFHRSTRVVRLTEEGHALLPRVNTILADLHALESTFQQNQELSGRVHVTCVPFVAHRLLIPVLKEFEKDYPNIQVHLELSKKFANIIETGIDLAIRIETPKDSELIYRKLVPNELIFCASPKYLKERATPREPSDLLKHNLLALDIHDRCKFKNTSAKLGNFTKTRKLHCGNGVFLTEMAIRDGGILVRSKWAVEEQLENGELVEVLANHPLETFGHIYAVIPSKRFLAPRVRVFLERVVAHASQWH